MKIEFHLWYKNYRRHFQIYLQWKCLNSNYNFTEFVPKGPIDYNSALVQVVAWHRTGEKPLPESITSGEYCHKEAFKGWRMSQFPWWRHQMETFSALLAFCAGNSPVHGEFPTQRPVTRSFDIFFDLRLNKRLSKQSWGWWSETPSSSLWRHRNAITVVANFWQRYLQYIPRNMHTVFALLCFVVVIHWLIFPYPSGLLHWHCGNLTIAPVPAKQPWWIWINTSCELIMNDCITTTKQSTTKPCAYFLGYTWSKPDGYGKISQCKTTTKHSKAKTVCIFLGIYCMHTSGKSVFFSYKTSCVYSKLLQNTLP